MNLSEDRDKIVSVLEKILSDRPLNAFRFAEHYIGNGDVSDAVILSIHRLTCVLDGQFCLKVGSGRQITQEVYSAGTTLMMRPFCTTAFAPGSCCEAFGLVCRPGFLRIFYCEAEDGRHYFYHLKDTLRTSTHHALSALFHLQDDRDSRSTMSDLLYLVFTLLKEDLKRSRICDCGKSFQLWCRISERLEEYYDADPTRSELAAEFEVTETYISRLFRRYAGTTFKEYLRLIRLKKSERLLNETNLTVSEIAWQCGFHSTTYFIRSFRSVHHVSPGHYRRLKK